jgi:hypothetical protein
MGKNITRIMPILLHVPDDKQAELDLFTISSLFLLIFTLLKLKNIGRN